MRTILVEVAVGLLLCLAVYMAWDKWSAPRPVGSESVKAAEAPALRQAPTAAVTIKAPVKAYQGKTKANLKLPAAVQENKDVEVIAASQVKADLHPQTISTTVNKETGEVQTFVKTDPFPWLAIETRGHIGIAYGYKYNHVMHGSAPVARLQIGYDVIRVKALTVGITGTVDSDSTAFVGVGVNYRW